MAGLINVNYFVLAGCRWQVGGWPLRRREDRGEERHLGASTSDAGRNLPTEEPPLAQNTRTRIDSPIDVTDLTCPRSIPTIRVNQIVPQPPTNK